MTAFCPYGGLFDSAARREEINRLLKETESPDIWLDQRRAQEVGRRLKALQSPLQTVDRLLGEVDDLLVLDELASEEDHDASRAEVADGAARAAEEVSRLELRELLRGKYDAADAIVSLHAGAGGTEAQDWVQMLWRMYQRWAEERGYQIEVLDVLAGDDAGVKSVAVEVRGEYAYGYLRPEKGVHRLVRISPFDASGRRHTSFASVDVLPVLEDEAVVAIDPEDLKIDTFRSGGAGGQHVNKTESAVRITHLPTGIVVACQNERSQHSNRETAMRMLRAKLLERKEEEERQEVAELRGDQGAIAWGNQIRSYVFQPYTLVKDHRTGTEIGNVQAVMDGELDPFIESFLRKQASGAS